MFEECEVCCGTGVMDNLYGVEECLSCNGTGEVKTIEQMAADKCFAILQGLTFGETELILTLLKRWICEGINR